MSTLTAIIITKNESHNIRACLESLSFCDEIIVFDSSSEDDTVNICHEYTPNVVVTPDWPGDGPQKNRAIDQATSDWIICLDADERVTPELREELSKAIQATSHVAFDIPFQSTYMGKAIKFGDWRGEHHVRLFKRNHARFTEAIVHCKLEYQGTLGQLKHKMLHHPFRDLHALLYKVNDYSTGSAKIKFEQGKRASFSKALIHGFWTFFRCYLLKLGFLDGKEGFMLAVSNAEGSYYRYLKLMYLAKT